MNLKHIAEGGDFDTVDAVRLLAKELYLAQTNMADKTPTATTEAGHTLAGVLNSKLAATLAAGGYADIESVRAATDDQLLAVAGMNDKALKLIREKLV